MQAKQQKEYYRPDELAILLGVSSETVRRWIRKGLVLHVHLLKGVRVPHEEFIRIRRDGVAQTHAK